MSGPAPTDVDRGTVPRPRESTLDRLLELIELNGKRQQVAIDNLAKVVDRTSARQFWITLVLIFGVVALAGKVISLSYDPTGKVQLSTNSTDLISASTKTK